MSITVRLQRIGGVEIDHVRAARAGSASSDSFHQVAVRVDDGATEAALNVLRRHCLNECRSRSLMVERNFGWVLGYFAAGLFFSPLIAFFGKRGFASANKGGQQHYVIPDAP
jgi:hypothetical protein